MATGTVKWFNVQKGYGFIQPSDGSRDVFVHITALQKANITNLIEGQQITYDLLTERGKTSAGNLKVG
ncbi:cold-shock protein [Pseudoxanthobacter sp. M-2]|uniref:cold-shock protein n=1 Tax=Pseudoxanthobacter sp. M-2 TaxID=3078754 RepID=UPI0038FBE7CD